MSVVKTITSARLQIKYDFYNITISIGIKCPKKEKIMTHHMQ